MSTLLGSALKMIGLAAKPAVPSSTQHQLYARSDSRWYAQHPAGTEQKFLYKGDPDAVVPIQAADPTGYVDGHLWWDSDEASMTVVDPSPFVSYTPTVSSITVGNATITGGYQQYGKLIAFWCRLICGSTTVMNGSPKFSLPVTARSPYVFMPRFCALRDVGGSYYEGLVGYNSDSTVNAYTRSSVAGAYAGLSTGTPFTWGVSDEIEISGMYEAL